MFGDNCQQWSCIECVIKTQEYENNLSKLEKRFLMYKQKLILTDELISKFNVKCKENETLQKQKKKYDTLLKEYQGKLISAVRKQMPLEEEVEKLKKMKVAVEEKLELETIRYAATEQHNIQLNNLVQQFKEKVVNFEKKLELQKEATSDLTRSLKEAETEKLSAEKKRLKTLQNVVSFADFVKKEGRLTSVHKKMLARWRTELECHASGEGDFSEDEGIFSPALSSNCSSRDIGLGSITDLLSDDEHGSVISMSMESNTTSVKDRSAAVPSGVTCKPPTSDHSKKVKHRNSSKLSSGTVVPLIFGLKSESVVGSVGIQLQESSEVAGMSGAESAKMNSSTSASVSLNKTYDKICDKEAVTENKSEVDKVKSGDRNLMAVVTHKAGPTSGTKSLGPLSLFDPDVPPALSGEGYNKETTTSEAVTNRNGADVVPIMDNSDSTSTATRVESPVDISLSIKNIMEEMSIPNPLSPVNSEPETSRSYGQSNSLLASTAQVEQHDASTWTWVEMSDAAVGVDKIADCPRHVAVQTSGITTCKTACQTNIITYNTCAVQTDDVDMLHTADILSHTEDEFSNCRLPKERTTCSMGKEHDKVKCISNTLTNDTAVTNNSLISYRSLSEGLEELNFPKLTPAQKSVESKKISILVRCDYKPEMGLKAEIKKWESLASWLCPDKSDNTLAEEDSSFVHKDFSTPAAAVQSCMSTPPTRRSTLAGDKHFTRQSTPPAGKSLIRQITPTNDKHHTQQSMPTTAKCLTQQSTQTTDRIPTPQNTPTHQNTLTASGVFAVDDAPHLLGYPKENHPHACLMPVVPYFQHHYMHMDPLLFHPHVLSRQLLVQSMADHWKNCCYNNAGNDICAKFNHPCVAQGLQNYCCSCSPCVSTNQSNCRPPKKEAKVQISTVRSASNKSAKRVWNRILDTEDSSDDTETGDDNRMPHRKLCLKNHIVNSTFTTDIDRESENTAASRRVIYADKQKYSLGTVSGRKMADKQLRERRKVHINGRDSAFSMNEEREKVVRSRNINLSLRGSKQTRAFSDNEQESSTFSKLKKIKKKYNESDEKSVIKCTLKEAMGRKFPLSKLKFRSKHLTPRQLSDHVEESETSGMNVGNEVCVSPHIAVEHIQDCKVGSHNVDTSAVLQSTIQRKTANIPVTEEDLHQYLPHAECGPTPDMCTGKEPDSGRTVVDLRTVQAWNVPDSSLNKCKRKACNLSANQVESSVLDCSFSETRKSKRTKTSFISKGSGDLVTSNGSEATSSVTWHSVSDSSPKKYATRTCRASTSIILPSVEQQSPNQEYEFPTANGKFKVLNTPGAGQAVGKPDASRHASQQIKLSKLEKLRRNIMRAKRPSKIATEVMKTVKHRKSLVLRSESSCAGSDCKKSGVRRLSETARKVKILDSVTNVSNQFHRLPQSTQIMSLKDEMLSAQHDTLAPDIIDEHVNHSNSSNPVVDHPLTCNWVTEQEPNMRREISTETNRAVEVSSVESMDVVLGAEIPSCFQDSVPLSSHVMQTVSYLSKVNNAPEVQTKSTLTGKVPMAVEVPALPVNCKEGVSEVSDLPKTTDLITLPDVCDKSGDISESVIEVCSPAVAHKTCEESRDIGDTTLPTMTSEMGDMEDTVLPNFYQELVPCCISPIRDPKIGKLQLSSEVKLSIPTSDIVQTAELPNVTFHTTISKAGDIENVVLPNFYQELVPCHISPIKDPEIGELQLSSEVKLSMPTSGTVQTAELPSAGLSNESSGRMTRSSMYQILDKHVAVVDSVVTKSTDRKPFAGSLLEWVLKDYEVQYKQKQAKKKKTMKEAKKTRAIKQKEKIIFKKEIQQFLSSDANSRKFQEVLKKFSDVKSKSAPLVLAKIIVKVVNGDIKDQLIYSQRSSAPPLTPTQQFLVTLVFTLQSQHEQYKPLLETILLGIEYQLFRLGHVPNVTCACSLARFYAALCLLHRDKPRIQAFCYDAMYSLNYKAFPLLFTVFTTYPDALPHADAGKDILLVKTMSCLILTQSIDRNQSEYRIRDLKILLQKRYGYSRGIPATDQLLQLLIDRLRNSDHNVEGLQASLILLAKRMGWDTTYRQLLCRKLIPLIDEWRAGAVSDRTITEVIIIMGYITRCFPTEEAKVQVQSVLHTLSTILLEQNVSIDVQEAAAASLFRLSRHNFFYISNLLVKWQPSGGSISDSLVRDMLPFFQLRNPKWWCTFLKRKQNNSVELKEY